MPTPLDARLVADSLTALTGWAGDPSRISRSVRLAGPELDRLLAEVAVAADSLDHHPVVERVPGGARFTLWTHSISQVSELDIALASRIDDLVLQIGGDSETSVAGAPTAEGTGTGVAGSGRRAGNARRTDADVVAEAGREGHTPAAATGDTMEPLIGVPAATAATPEPGVALPDADPSDAQPGIGRDDGQGTPPVASSS